MVQIQVALHFPIVSQHDPSSLLTLDRVKISRYLNLNLQDPSGSKTTAILDLRFVPSFPGPGHETTCSATCSVPGCV